MGVFVEVKAVLAQKPGSQIAVLFSVHHLLFPPARASGRAGTIYQSV